MRLLRPVGRPVRPALFMIIAGRVLAAEHIPPAIASEFRLRKRNLRSGQ